MSVNEVKIKKSNTELEVRGTGDPCARTFAIGDEDHTLGNALRHVLLHHSQIGFAGYSVPHPSEPVVHIRVQTLPPPPPPKTTTKGTSKNNNNHQGGSGGSSNRLTAIDALKESAMTLQDACDFLLDQVEELLPEVKEDRKMMDDFAASNYFMNEEEEEEGMEGGEEEYDMEEAY